MKRLRLPLIAVLLVVVALPLFAGRGRTVDRGAAQPVAAMAAAKLTSMYTVEEIQKGVYVGNEFCLACHPQAAVYKTTDHASFLRRPMVEHSLKPGKGVIADYDKNNVDDFIQGLDFNKITSAFDKYKPNAPVLSVEAGQYYITVADAKMPVIFTMAGQVDGSAQRFGVKIPAADRPNKLSVSNYIAPLQYTPGTGWAPYSPQYWYDATTNAPRWSSATVSSALTAHGGNHASGCVGCHANGIRTLMKLATGETWFQGYTAVLYQPNDPTVFDYDGDGTMDLMNIGCESCHGPGALHIMGNGDPSKIANPKKMDAQFGNAVCGRCHLDPKSVPNKTWSWPYDEVKNETWTPLHGMKGIKLEDYYVDNSTHWPDGKHGKSTRPYHDFINGAKPTYQYHKVTCYECHNPHDMEHHHMLRTEMEEMEVEVENNTFCLSCHSTHGPFEKITKEMVKNAEEETNHEKIAKIVMEHTHHPYAPTRSMGLSRCTTCHMAKTFGRGTPTGPSHTFEAISPEKTLKYLDQKGGMINSCAQGCHGFNAEIFNIGPDPDQNRANWDSAYDKKLSEMLKYYYGKEGIWWKGERWDK
jgi:hypothetical protein